MLTRARYLLAALALSASAAIVGVTGMGSFPVSQSTLAFWLLQADGKPLVMVYYHGPAQWHDAEWNVNSQFTNTAVGWGELKSAKATLHIRVDLGAGRAEIQHKAFALAENNTFLVVHTTDAQQKIIPLGHHDLLKTAENPAAVMLLNADKALKKRIQNEAGSI
jgi:hypothetical protein